MGGRGSSSGLGGGSSIREKPFKIPKFTTALLKNMSRQQLETLAGALSANRALESGLSLAEGLRRFELLKDGNTDAQLRKSIAKSAKKYW